MNEVINYESSSLIAPCGMNCSICVGFQREKNRCPGCRNNGHLKPSYCKHCIIKNCVTLSQTESGFCYECLKFPCRRLKQLDKRYQTRYNMSMLENLEYIKTNGLKAFVEKEQTRWLCPKCGAILCVHRKFCLSCKADILSV